MYVHVLVTVVHVQFLKLYYLIPLTLLSCRYSIGSAPDGPLVSSSVKDFIQSIGSRASTPGGGSASACIASIGTALATMVLIIG